MDRLKYEKDAIGIFLSGHPLDNYKLELDKFCTHGVRQLSIINKVRMGDTNEDVLAEFEKLKEGSMWLYQVLSQNLGMPVLGPEEPMVSRIRNKYIRTILVKIPTEYHLGKTKKTIQKILNSFEAVAQYRAIKVTVNVDNY